MGLNTFRKQLYSLGYTSFFSGGLKDSIARIGKVVPIDANADLVRAMKVSAIILRANKVLLIFPEGGLSCDGQLQSFKKGAPVLARELGLPVVPAAIKGTFNVWRKGDNRIHLAPVEVIFGEPLDFKAQELQASGGEDDYALLALKLEDAVRRLMSSTPGAQVGPEKVAHPG